MLCDTWSSEVFARSSIATEHVLAAKMLHKRAEEEESVELFKTAAARWSEGGRPGEKSLCQVLNKPYLTVSITVVDSFSDNIDLPTPFCRVMPLPWQLKRN